LSRTRHQRTNAVTRKRTERQLLVHWVLGEDGMPSPDWTGRTARLGAKGVWLESSEEAVRLAVQRQVFTRAWGVPAASLDAETLLGAFVRQGEHWFYQRLGLAARSNALAIGQEAVREGMQASPTGLLLLAADAGESARERFARNAVRKGCTVLEIATGGRLAAALGRDFVSCAWVAQAPWVDDLRWAGRSLNGLPDATIVRYDEGAAQSGRESDVVATDDPGDGDTHVSGHDALPRE
jgi:hypothetical protein